jgi:signal transduction histidine kinase
MTVRQRLLLTLLLGLLLIAAASVTLHWSQKREAAATVRALQAERANQLDQMLAEEGVAVALFTSDYSCWNETVEFVRARDLAWADRYFNAALGRFGLDSIWVLTAAGEVVYHAQTERARGAAMPLRPTDLPAGPRPPVLLSGYAGDWQQLMVYSASPIQSAQDSTRQSPPEGWLVAGRVLAPDHLTSIERGLRARVSLHRVNAAKLTGAQAEISVERVIVDQKNQPVAIIRATFATAAADLNARFNSYELMVIVGMGLLTLGLMFYSVQRFVLAPLEHIGASLEQRSAAPLAKIPQRLREFERIGHLMREAFAQRVELEHEIEERARLGRDLHDGVIQTLYAAGLGLAHARRILPQDLEAASERLTETQGALNDAMGDLRRFIARAEPESEAAQRRLPLDEACNRLFDVLRAQRVCALQLVIDPRADSELPAAVKDTLLQIIREGASNALRHGAATAVKIVLRRASEADWQLLIHDDGEGFDPKNLERRGHGLDNLSARTSGLDGTLVLDSAPKSGTRILITFPNQT